MTRFTLQIHNGTALACGGVLQLRLVLIKIPSIISKLVGKD
jgi:hypothetical protein